jgi:hypothetical protein
MKILVPLILPVIIFSCKAPETTLKLNTEIITPPDCKKLDITVGYYHSPEFLARQDSLILHPPFYKIKAGYDYYFIPVGTSSDTLFKNIYPKLFDSVLPVNTTAGNTNKEIDFILKPEIVSLQLTKKYFNCPNWVEIIYLVTMCNPEGKELVSWTVVGWGDISKSGFYDKETGEKLARNDLDKYQKTDYIYISGNSNTAIENALQNAANKFIKSFDQVPEVKRCLNGLSFEDVTVTPEMLDTVMIPQGADSTLTIGYKGIVSARIKCDYINRVPLRNKISVMDTIGVTSIEVFLKNEGSDKLFIDPLNITWTPAGEQIVYPISPAALSEKNVGTRYKDGYSMGQSIFALIILGVDLAYDDPIQLKEFETRLKYFSREALGESTLDSNTSVTGNIYFPSLPDAPDSGELEIPVINLDTATRYIIRFKIQKDTKIKEINFN